MRDTTACILISQITGGMAYIGIDAGIYSMAQGSGSGGSKEKRTFITSGFFATALTFEQVQILMQTDPDPVDVSERVTALEGLTYSAEQTFITEEAADG